MQEPVGDDVRKEPRRTYVGFARKRQFCVAAPSARRLDLGLRLDHPP